MTALGFDKLLVSTSVMHSSGGLAYKIMLKMYATLNKIKLLPGTYVLLVN